MKKLYESKAAAGSECLNDPSLTHFFKKAL